MKKRNTKHHRRRRNEDHEVKIFHFPETVAHQQQTNSTNSFFADFVRKIGELARSVRAKLWSTKT